jgi:hypothetical protein
VVFFVKRWRLREQRGVDLAPKLPQKALRDGRHHAAMNPAGERLEHGDPDEGGGQVPVQVVGVQDERSPTALRADQDSRGQRPEERRPQRARGRREPGEQDA